MLDAVTSLVHLISLTRHSASLFGMNSATMFDRLFFGFSAHANKIFSFQNSSVCFSQQIIRKVSGVFFAISSYAVMAEKAKAPGPEIP